MAQIVRAFTIEAPPNSDIWKKPPHTDVWTAPSSLDQAQTIPLDKFQSARISFSGAWTERYDQAGILLLIQDATSSTSWIKAGLEYYNNTPQISFVGCDRFADWSVHPVTNVNSHRTTVELRREGDENGVALWAYEVMLDENGDEVARHPFRECTWLWHKESEKQIRVAAYCARPANKPELGRLRVYFEELAVRTKG